MLHIVWSLVRRRVTRRLTSLQTMYNVIKYNKTWWENDDISIYRYRIATGNKFNLIMRMTKDRNGMVFNNRNNRYFMFFTRQGSNVGLLYCVFLFYYSLVITGILVFIDSFYAFAINYLFPVRIDNIEWSIVYDYMYLNISLIVILKMSWDAIQMFIDPKYYSTAYLLNWRNFR